MFYGTECVHCHEMEPLVTQLEEELHVKVVRLETWHNAQNRQLLEQCDKIDCGGVPFFFNEKTKEGICGEVPYKKLKAWASA